MKTESKKRWRSRMMRAVDGKPKKEKKKDCFSCNNCEYIGEGDYACMKGTPLIVIESFSVPTASFLYCLRH